MRRLHVLRVASFGLAVLGLETAAAAQELLPPPEAPPPPDAPAAPEEEAAPEGNNGAVSASLGVDFVSRYYFRGIVQEIDPGLTLQPYGEIGFNLYSGEKALSSVDLAVGTWNSLHTGSSGGDAPAAGQAEEWYESDFYTSLGFTFGGMFGVSVGYTGYASPNSFFKTTHELALGLSFDDSSLYGDNSRFGGVQPSITLATELAGGAMGDKGTFLGIGIEPGVSLVDGKAVTLGVAAPISLGLGLSKYYDIVDPVTGDSNDSAFGYFSPGLALALGLAFIPEKFGAWEVGVKGQGIILGSNTEWADSSGDTRSADFVFTAGIGMSY